MITETIQSIPASAFEWILTNIPAFGILIFIGWCVWKYLTWLNNRFSHNDQQLHQHGYQIENVDKRMTKVEGEMEDLKENVHKVQKDLAVLDMKIDKMDERFDAVIQRFDDKFDAVIQRFDDRFDAVIQRFDDKFGAIIQRSDDKFAAVNQRFQEVHQRFDVIDKRFDRVEKRFESYDQRFLAQNEFNLKMLSLLEASIKNNPQSNANTDLRIQKT